MPLFPCPYLNASVELTDERERHIAEHHPELLPSHREWLAETLAVAFPVMWKREMAHSSGREVNDQRAAWQGGHRRNAPWAKVPGSRPLRMTSSESRWANSSTNTCVVRSRRLFTRNCARRSVSSPTSATQRDAA